MSTYTVIGEKAKIRKHEFIDQTWDEGSEELDNVRDEHEKQTTKEGQDENLEVSHLDTELKS